MEQEFEWDDAKAEANVASMASPSMKPKRFFWMPMRISFRIHNIQTTKSVFA